MADWTGHARSNYFRVKDVDAFTTFINNVPGIAFWTKDNDSTNFAIFADVTDHGGWPDTRDIEGQDDNCYDMGSLADDLVQHLAENEVAILMEIGNERLRYFTFRSTAVTWDGRRIDLDSDEIYDRVVNEFNIIPTSVSF